MNPSAQPASPGAPEPPPRSQRVLFFTLIVMLLVVLGLVLTVFQPFLIILGLATALTLLLKPLHLRLTAWMRGHAGLSALSIVIGTTVIILIPVLGILATIASQALNFYQWVAPRLTSGELVEWAKLHLHTQTPWFTKLQEISEGRVADFVAGALTRLASAANNLMQGAVTGLTAAAFELALLLIMLFFFLRDGQQFRAQIRRVSPLSRAQADELMDQIARTMQGAITSLLLVPLIQGALATLGYWVLGIPNALLWGGLTTLVAFIPLIGTPLVWAPICVYLFIDGQVWQGVVLAVYGAVVISSIDNVLRPWIMQGATNIHPLWSFLAILGGLIAFGAMGLLIGPLILSLGVSALHIYEMDVLRGGAVSRLPLPAAPESPGEPPSTQA
ncbi:MAG TPA: AI-2E family transporter [Burkholderiales bacterium]|nr:AI-2E family transporter [Burkholderiales bacterium]